MRTKMLWKGLIAVLAIAFGFAPQSRAQVGFMHAIGGTYLLGIGPEVVQGMPAVTYNPRLHFGLGDELSVAVSALPTLGLYGSFNSQTGGEGGVGVDLPLNFQIHWGMGSGRDSDKSFGLYAGLGIDFAALGSASYFGSDSGTFLGPGFELGTNFMAGPRPLGIRAKFLYDIASDNLGVFGMGIVYHFGMR